MGTFNDAKQQARQEHFTIVEIDLPVVNGTCTISGLPGYGTPLSCDQPPNGIKTYKFTNYSGVLPESDIHKIITSISDSPTELQIGTGLARRGTMSVTLIDKKGDPNPFAPAVTSEIRNTGSFLAKMNARYVLTNNVARRKDYIIEQDGTIDLVNGAQTSYFIIDTFKAGRNNTWIMTFKDELSKTNFGESVYPPKLEGYLRNDINDTETLFNVDPNIAYNTGQTIRLGDELCKIVGVSNIGTASAQIQVQPRGFNIAYTNILSITTKEAHSAGDEIFLCDIVDNERVDDLVKRILEAVGIDSSLIPIADWAKEIDEWGLSLVNTIFVESMETSKLLNNILVPRQINCWFDPIDRQVKLAAINAWKDSVFDAHEGVGISDNAVIDYDTVTIQKEENLRATRAYIVYDKPNLTESNDFKNYRKASISARTELETIGYFGVEPKVKSFDFSDNIDKTTADLLTSRYVQRNSDPYSLTWTTQESKKNFKVGDVGNIKTSAVLDFNGLASTDSRGQIISIKPRYTNFGREYLCKALVYEPAFATGTEILLTGNVSNVDLYVRAGAPSQAVNITFVFDAAISSSSDSNLPSIKAGNFALGSKIIIILANSSYLMSKGGDGGRGGGALWDGETSSWLPSPQPGNGGRGGVCYDAQGVDTDIYFSGATPSTNYPNADGYILAPSGGDGGFSANVSAPIGGNGGNGGDGSSAGLGGIFGTVTDAGGVGYDGISGSDGTTSLTGNFGQNGANNNAFGGIAGAGVKDSGATVVFYGSSGTRYINGSGDH